MRIGSALASGTRHIIGVSFQALIVAAIVVALAFAAAVTIGSSPTGADSVFAAKGGNGNGNGGNGNANGTSLVAASVSASPNPAARGTNVEVTGCGYDVNYPVELRITHPDASLEAYGVGVWYTGCMNPTPILVNDLGTYAIEVWQRSSRDSRLMATTSLAVG